ncbi:diguanylate cyclase [Piscinibacter sp. HJYY11]|uniref:diguanylate cyclase n=1 Tax=Piscinibacter sp. HJYY11 TaxID=2801333 RepID=UPI00191EB13B|nr:diguanylate cyclase [Piscinibacter sp. HJYY11]MBL0726547.1 sensor domain-containing diguanylate cyclase [Piscinibacter sp. HJYY11]
MIDPRAKLLRLLETTRLEALVQHLHDDLIADGRVAGFEVNLHDPARKSLVTADLRLPGEYAGIEGTYRGFQYVLDRADANASVFTSRTPLVVVSGDLDRFYETTRMRFERWRMRSLLVLPLLMPGAEQPIGTLTVFSRDHLLGAADLPAFASLAALYAPQLKLHWELKLGASRSQTVEHMATEIHQFVEYIAEMNSLTAVDQVYASISREFMRRFGLDMVNILMAEDDHLTMVHSAFSEPFAHLAAEWEQHRCSTAYSLTVHDGQSALVYMHGQRLVVADAQKILHLPMSAKDRRALELLRTVRSFSYVPIRLHEKVIGLMWLVTLSEQRVPTEAQLTLIDLLASFISTAIVNAQAHMRVEEQTLQIGKLNTELEAKVQLLDELARKDKLTGLNNFGALEEEMRRRISEAHRSPMALSMILVDIDHFKRFNDTFGHPAGNVVLKRVAQVISKAVRDMDFVARYGGEEFAVLLPHCDLPSALAVAERVRADIEAAVIDNGDERHQVTISAGCAVLGAQEASADFVSRVDAALYESKHAGRNRVTAASPRKP